MNESKKKKKGKIYRPSKASRYAILGIALATGIFMVVAMRGMLTDGEDIPTYGILATGFMLLMVGVFIWYAFIYTYQSYLVVSEEGLDVVQGTSQVFIAWENMQQFNIRSSGKATHIGVLLHKKVRSEAEAAADKIFFQGESNFVTLSHIVNIPIRWSGILKLHVDQAKFKQTSFGADLYRYAPQLFDDAKAK